MNTSRSVDTTRPLMTDAPLLSAHGLRFVGPDGEPVAGPDELRVPGASLALLEGARGLFPALIQPELLVDGEFKLVGQQPRSALARGLVGVAPKALPVPPGLALGTTLGLSAHLIDCDAERVPIVLEQLGLGTLARRKVGDLSPLQLRLAGLAHALLSEPELVLLDDLFDGLTDDACEVLELMLDSALGSRRWIAVVTMGSVWSRRLLLSAENILAGRFGSLVGPFSPDALRADTLFARFRQVTAGLREELERVGAQVLPVPHPEVLLVRGIGGKAILRAGLAANCDLLELTPAGSAS